MTKIKLKRKELKQHVNSVNAATRVRLFAEGLTRQAQLDTWLLQEDDLQKRERLYDFIKPFLKFKNRFPERIFNAG